MHGVKHITLTFLALRSGSWQKCQSALELRDNSHIKGSICMCNSKRLVRHKDFLCIYIRVRLRPHISVRVQESSIQAWVVSSSHSGFYVQTQAETDTVLS